MIHRKGRCRTFRLCMTCRRLMWPFQKALFTQCGPNTENPYHHGECAVTLRPEENMRQERAWAREVERRQGDD